MHVRGVLRFRSVDQYTRNRPGQCTGAEQTFRYLAHPPSGSGMRGNERGGTIRSTFELPSHRESRFWLAAGLLLPVSDRWPLENMRVHQFTADDGKALIGHVLDAEQVSAARASFGLDGGRP